MEGEYHWFASSALNWSTGRTREEVLKRQRKADKPGPMGIGCKACNLFKVPGPVSAEYEIREYRPQVPGTEFVEKVTY